MFLPAEAGWSHSSYRGMQSQIVTGKGLATPYLPGQLTEAMLRAGARTNSFVTPEQKQYERHIATHIFNSAQKVDRM